MCGRFSNSKDPSVVAQHFQAMLAELPDDLRRFNIAPRHVVLAVRYGSESMQREIVPLRWGLIPSWAKDHTIGNKLINARGETVDQKPAFKSAFKRRRCLIPADGFFEWCKRTDRGFEYRKQPYYIRFLDKRVFGFAGLWEHWKDHRGRNVESCTIITTVPNEVVKPIHDRMPVIVREQDYEDWLMTGPDHSESLQNLLTPFPSSDLVAIPIGLGVKDPKVDDPRCVEPIAEEKSIPGIKEQTKGLWAG